VLCGPYGRIGQSGAQFLSHIGLRISVGMFSGLACRKEMSVPVLWSHAGGENLEQPTVRDIRGLNGRRDLPLKNEYVGAAKA
jgi:hypothetical protein